MQRPLLQIGLNDDGAQVVIPEEFTHMIKDGKYVGKNKDFEDRQRRFLSTKEGTKWVMDAKAVAKDDCKIATDWSYSRQRREFYGSSLDSD